MRSHLTRRMADDRGVVLVEFILVVPVLLLLVMGIFEYGNAYRQVGSVERAAQQGARAVSAGANSRYADFEALRAIDTATRGLPGMTVERVVIYRVETVDGEVPSECLTASRSGLCNRYTGERLRSSSPHGFGGTGTCAGGSWDSSWCPLGRPREHDSLVRIGVHLTLTYQPVTRLLPTSITIEKSAVYQIDPCQQGQETC